jgi:hypothetical protein
MSIVEGFIVKTHAGVERARQMKDECDFAVGTTMGKLRNPQIEEKVSHHGRKKRMDIFKKQGR